MSELLTAPRRVALTVVIMLTTLMQTLDMTIANVALPHIQGSVSASLEQIGWVLTSYILASGVITPLTGWMIGRFGRKTIFLTCVIGFTVASMLCGLATSLQQIVLFRVLQGLSGALLVPLAQTVLLDVYPPAKHGVAMAVWSIGAMQGPILGPVLGGWLTENLSWRWCFFINLPVGLLAGAGVWAFMPSTKHDRRPLDFGGFGALVMFIVGLQLTLDRGPTLDWFASPEIWTYVAFSMAGLWMFVMQTLFADKPFFERALLRDRTFLICCLLGFIMNTMIFASMALLPTMVQHLLGYPVLAAGVLLSSRGIGAAIALVFIARYGSRLEPRQVVFAGMLLTLYAQWQMEHFDLTMPSWPIAVSGLIQGLATGSALMTISTLGFSTLAPRLRADGAAVFTMTRTIGSSVGISVLQATLVHGSAVMHASLTEHVSPDNPVGQASPGHTYLADPTQLALVNAEIDRQAAMVGYLNDFKLLTVVTLICLPLVFLIRRGRTESADPPSGAHLE